MPKSVLHILKGTSTDELVNPYLRVKGHALHEVWHRTEGLISKAPPGSTVGWTAKSTRKISLRLARAPHIEIVYVALHHDEETEKHARANGVLLYTAIVITAILRIRFGDTKSV